MMRKTKERNYVNPEFTHSDRDPPSQGATTPRSRRTQDSTTDPCTPLAVRFARRYIGIICEENLALESSTASEDSAGIVADGHPQHFMDMTLCQEAGGRPEPPRKAPELKLNHRGSMVKEKSEGKDFRPQSANVLGADQSVPKHRSNGARAHHPSEATTRRRKEEGRQVDSRAMVPVIHTPPRSSPTEATRKKLDDASHDIGGSPIQRGKKTLRWRPR